MTDEAALLEQAAKCRRLAQSITDGFARDALLELPADLERRAGERPEEPPTIMEIVPQ